MPPHKLAMGYRHEPDKLSLAGLTAMPSERVGAPRIRECPVQLEAVLTSCHPIGRRDATRPSHLLTIEVEVVRAHVDERLLAGGREDRIDPDAWRPLIMSFCRFYGLGEQVHPSRLAEIPESAYRRAGGASRRRRVPERRREPNGGSMDRRSHNGRFR